MRYHYYMSPVQSPGGVWTVYKRTDYMNSPSTYEKVAEFGDLVWALRDAQAYADMRNAYEGEDR